MYFNVNFSVLFKLIKVHLLVSELYIPVIVREERIWKQKVREQSITKLK